MQFSRIRLENWRNFSEVDVALQTRAFLVGANATGKSNFLDVFRLLRDLVTPGGGFQEVINRRGGVSSIRNLAARRYPNIVIDVELGEEDEVLWRYRMVFNQDNISRPVLREEKIWQKGKVKLARPDDEDAADPARLSQTYLEQTFANRDYRDITEFFKTVSYLHIVPQLVRDPERSVGRQADPFGGDFLEQVAKTNRKTQEARLRRIQKALRIAVPQLSGLELFRDKRGLPHVRGKYEHWRRHGAWQRETEFSDGTLRLMGLLWALQEGSGPLLLEEPELSLHPGVVRYLPQMIYSVQKERRVDRQIFISTHSSDLLRDEGIAADEVLLFLASAEGTQVQLGVTRQDIREELDLGFTMADVVLPRTEPPNVRQLALFGDEA